MKSNPTYCRTGSTSSLRTGGVWLCLPKPGGHEQLRLPLCWCAHPILFGCVVRVCSQNGKERVRRGEERRRPEGGQHAPEHWKEDGRRGMPASQPAACYRLMTPQRPRVFRRGRANSLRPPLLPSPSHRRSQTKSMVLTAVQESMLFRGLEDEHKTELLDTFYNSACVWARRLAGGRASRQACVRGR